ncbi:hypothetical protein [Candidatus Phytoplasma meliae]|uniref:Uncharacterized protein n=1 Tax=Candidatus Phytoplasma meliae TaxID=1848402 RepID=A0ABS5CY17_9MOLU|nr:hypothetical protein [Candidatus Phytoplasma meliae]MBP5835866.1 hypothetical protein [Candidatus Phytoplasma meliae]
MLNNTPSFPYHNNITSTTIEFYAKPIKKINIYNAIQGNDYLLNKLKTCTNQAQVENVLQEYNLINEYSKQYLSYEKQSFDYSDGTQSICIKPTPFRENPYYDPHGKIFEVSPDYN